MAGAVVVFVLLIEGEPLASIGWTAPSRDDARAGAIALVGGLVAFSSVSTLLARFARRSPDERVVSAIAQLPLGLLVASAVSAGATEEVVFRGFGIERLGEAIDSYGGAGVITLAAFALLHLPRWGLPTTVAITAGPGIALTWLYVATRNLPVCIAVHTANDLWALAAAPRVLRSPARAT